MVRYSAITLLLLAFLATEARSGEEVKPSRKEFKQSPTYPYVFVPVGYLSNGGPLPLMFGPAASDCENRNPPPLPKPKKEKEKLTTGTSEPSKTGTSAPATPAPTPAAPASLPEPPAPEVPPTIPEPPMPAYPAPSNEGLPQDDSLDLNKYPSEVIGIFKNPYTVTKSHQHFFDPIFEPPQSQNTGSPNGATTEAPPSKATYRQQ